jgi:para-aminobenzoate synthetase/4-amino-4-deoxychorismate lyase
MPISSSTRDAVDSVRPSPTSPDAFLIDALAQPGTVLLDASRPDPAGSLRPTPPRSLLFTSPSRILRTDAPSQVAAVLSKADEALAAGQYVAGALAYEAGLALMEMPDPVLAQMPDGPLVWLGVYDEPAEFSTVDLDAAFDTVQRAPDVQNAHFHVAEATYHEAIARIKHYIREGDVYQINYTGPVRFDLDAQDPLALYAQMRRRQPVPYGAFLNLGATQLLCASPELFIRQDGNRLVTKPMKGTIRRGMTLEEDARLRKELASDPKSRAENLMIVDLLRNDLSVCCRPGSVRVPALFSTDTYDTLTQMTSTVEGTLEPGTSFSEILRALFPCGSITGAPKRRAVQRIHELETQPRGFYCGAIGYAAPDDTACFNVAIRTVELREGPGDTARLHGTMGTGSGVVWDSDPSAEYEECKLKARFLTDPPSEEPPFCLIETMRAEEGGIPLWERHWERLKSSAAYFGFPAEREVVEEAIQPYLAASEQQPVVIRLTLGRRGDADITTRPVPKPTEWSLAVVTETPNPHDPFFYHKTTRRDAYSRAWDEARAAGYDEAILVAPNGRVTEGARSNIIAEFGDRGVTPPVEEGLLGGVYRAHLLATDDRLEEAPLTVYDLRRADRIYCCNAVRGRFPATLDADLRPPGDV